MYKPTTTAGIVDFKSFATFKLACMKVQEELLQSWCWRCPNVKVFIFISLNPLNMLMDLADTLHVVRYWAEDLYYTIMTHLSDLEVKVTDLAILC